MNRRLYIQTLIILYIIPSIIFGQSKPTEVKASFTGPDTTCKNTPIQFTNTSVGASNYYWSFCAAGFNTTPAADNLGNPGNHLKTPVFMDYALDDSGNYYGFISNYENGHIVRLNYGNSLLNTPTATDLGNFSLIPIYAEGIQVKKDNGKCYVFVVAAGNDQGTNSVLVRLDFGNSFSNSPTAISLGNKGQMQFPHDLFITQENNNYYGFTINIINSTITRFDFGNDLANIPSGVNLGSIGNFNYPCGFSFVNENGNWYAFITNRDNNSISRLNFGASLINVPTGNNIGNPGGFLNRPRDISIFQSCEGIVGLVVNEEDEQTGTITKLDFGVDLLSNPQATDLGNQGNLKFPHSISKFFLEGNDIYSFITNVTNNTITRLRYVGCTSTNISSSTLHTPPPVIYSEPGIYNINLLVDIGLPTQTSFCKQIVVKDCTPPVTASFTAPDTVCVNNPVKIKNTSTGATSYYWSFCQADIKQTPQGKNLGNINSAFSLPNYSDIVSQNGKFYVFVVNNYPGGLTRLDFGNNLLNNPTSVSLGNLGGVIEDQAEGIQIVNSNGNWYGIMVGGSTIDGTTPQILKIDFGSNITNTSPTVTDWGNIGNMEYPHKLYVFKENNLWYGFTANYGNNTITRFDFGPGFTNPPSGSNLGGFGMLNGPTGINAIEDNNKWYVFVTNALNSKITRLNFGNSLLNTPTANDLGNINATMHKCFDIYIQKYCDGILGFVVNGDDNYNDIVRLDFNNDLTSVPTAISMGNIGQLSFPHSFSKLFREGNDLYSIIPNAHNNTLTRIKFSGCNNSSIPGSTLVNPPDVMYDSAGVYNISLNVDEGLPTQTSFCKQIVVINCDSVCNLKAEFEYQQTICDPKIVQFKNTTTNADSIWWDFGNGKTDTSQNPAVKYLDYGQYIVHLYAKTNSGCFDTATDTIMVYIKKDSAIITKDTSICAGSSVQLNAINGLNYCWSTGKSLSDSSIQNPVASPAIATTYYLNSQTLGKNLVVNGNFSDGNTGFSSEYGYQPPPNTNEGKYWIGINSNVWNASMSSCTDHTNGNGNMMMINGALQTNINVWKQTIPVLPNTNYAFSTWIQSLYAQNPAQLQFSINGRLIGNIFNANNNTCIWNEFYSTWNSGNSTSATISIVNMNSIREGNDFALDDISFSEYIFKQDSVTINVVNLPVVNAGNDTSICQGASVQLNAKGAITYNWNATPGLSDTTISNPVASPLNTENFIVRGYNTQGCFDTDTVKIMVLAVPVIKLTNDTAICKGGSIMLQAITKGNNKFRWVPATGLSEQDIFNPVASPADSTKYYVNVTDSNNCEAIDSVKVDVLNIPVVSTINDTGICKGNNITLKTNAAYATIFKWTPNSGLSNANIQSPYASPLTSTLYTVTAGNGVCSTKDSVLITILSLPAVKTGNDTTICGNASAQLYASGATSYLWKPVNGLSDPHISDPVASPGSTTKYYITGAGSNSCANTDSVTVFVQPAPAFNISPKNIALCKGDSVTLKASGGDTYIWSPSVTVTDPLAPVTKVFPSASTIYHVVITNTVCRFTDSLQSKVTVLDLPVATITKSNDIDCINFEAQLVATGGVSYQWYPLTYISNTHIANPVVNPPVDTKYSVVVKNENSCKTKDSVIVQSNNLNATAAKFEIASAFTPNHDGLNDCFSIKYWGPADFFDISIYDRWGYPVYHSNNINNCWDGTVNGKPQGSGTYVYKITVSSNCSNGLVHKNGTLVLIR